MTPSRRKELECSEATLTDDEIEQGYVFCCEWDGMLINKNDPEAECCHCLKESQT